MTTIESNLAHSLRRAVRSAVLAPSVHNTQPWRFVLRGPALELYADPKRQLAVLDPTGRQLHLSLGCALFNARVALAASGVPETVTYFPDPEDRQFVARIEPRGDVDASLAHLAPLIELRQTNRRHFETDPVPADVVELLVASAAAERATLFAIENADDRATLARLSQRADAEQITNPAYRAELRSWTTTDEDRDDGVPARVVPHVDGSAGDDVPIRDFDSQGVGWLPAMTRSSAGQCLFVLGTDTDSPRDWVRAGEALERVWLEITRSGFVASLFTQAIEIGSIRAKLRSELRLAMQPHLVLRVGRARVTAASPRRRVSDVLDGQPEA